ncbi:contractile injection system protein, VgrG/Pvc8 family, partial [Serratia ureilytica]|uniref:contractile injection system protein, VgrG/Pvc8 family n=1 Tax=Serratia ureilytica TaxID=300181 RepID=UPI0030CA5B12
ALLVGGAAQHHRRYAAGLLLGRPGADAADDALRRYLPGSFEIPWNPNTRTEVSTLCISQFRYSAQIRPSSVVTKDYTFKRPGWAGRFDQEGQHQDYQRTQYE